MLDRNKKALSLPPYNIGNPRKLLGELKANMKPITLPDDSVMEPPAMHVDGRKIVLLGDTFDAESEEMDRYAMDADLLVHEATNAFLPGLDDAIKEGDTYQEIAKKSRQHGHSTPQVWILSLTTCLR
jgi:ribonuclease Z